MLPFELFAQDITTRSLLIKLSMNWALRMIWEQHKRKEVFTWPSPSQSWCSSPCTYQGKRCEGDRKVRIRRWTRW